MLRIDATELRQNRVLSLQHLLGSHCDRLSVVLEGLRHFHAIVVGSNRGTSLKVELIVGLHDVLLRGDGVVLETGVVER